MVKYINIKFIKLFPDKKTFSFFMYCQRDFENISIIASKMVECLSNSPIPVMAWPERRDF